MNTEKIKDVLEKEFGDKLNVCSVDVQDGQYYAELEFYSDAGEDFVFDIWFDNTWNDFVDDFRRYAEDFDPDDHASMWVDSRGKNGVPDSVRELIEDADSIKEFLKELSEGLKYDKYDDDWDEAEV